jgi:hypothetical protein
MDHMILKVLRMKHNLYNDFRLPKKQVIRMLPLEKKTCFSFLLPEKITQKEENLCCGMSRADFLAR